MKVEVGAIKVIKLELTEDEAKKLKRILYDNPGSIDELTNKVAVTLHNELEKVLK